MIKVYLVPSRKITREYLMIKQGLINNPRVELVEHQKDGDFIFLFYTTLKHQPDIHKIFPRPRTVFMDFHDNPNTVFPVECLAYFKRSWVEPVGIRKKQVKKWPSHYHPIHFAIMDEFIVDENPERDIELSCTLRPHKKHPGRGAVLDLIRGMKIPGKTQIGELNQGHMNRFNDSEMQEYFRLLRRSRIVVTCNPTRWEGDFRTWEALASGALVFIDRMFTPMVHPLVDGKHCIFYEISKDGFKDLQRQIVSALLHPVEAATIARQGHEFAMKYHRASNRIDEILEIIT